MSFIRGPGWNRAGLNKDCFFFKGKNSNEQPNLAKKELEHLGI
jgi:hypothetical protein